MKSNMPFALILGIAAALLQLFFLFNSNAEAQEGGISPFVAVDMYGAFKVDKESAATDLFEIREAEFSLSAPVDHIFDGTFAVAAHSENGVHLFELHEAWLSTTKLIPRMQLKAGQFFLGVGRLNRIHRHDWPFMSAPVVHQSFFGDEGVLDSGAEASSLLPTPFFLELTFGLTNGWVYGHTHDEGEKPRKPTHYVRLATAGEILGGDTLFAANYLSRTTAANERTQLFGSDFVAKWKHGTQTALTAQGEFWQRQVSPPNAAKKIEQGAYLFAGRDIFSSTGIGLRTEYFTNLTLKDALGQRASNSISGVAPQISYRPSEFSSMRAGVNFQDQQQADNVRKINRILEFQLVYLMGAHPAHDF